MQSKAKTVEAYLRTVPENRKEALPQLGFMSQKNVIGLYILEKDVLDQYRDEMKRVSIGKGAIRCPNPSKIDYELVTRLLVGTRVSSDKICPRP